MLFEGKNVSFKYRLGSQWVEALREVSFSIAEREFVGLVGPSGSGKTTLLNLLGLIEPIQEGVIAWNGRTISGLNDRQKNTIRRHDVGFIFQTFQLFPVLSAEENVQYFLHRQRLPGGEIRSRVENALKSVGLWEHRMKRPLEMSGGQRQRVAIARALAKKPKVIFADEPTASLDQKTGADIVEILKIMNEKEGVTIVLSSHDPMVQERMKRLIRLKDGQIVDGGSR